MLSRAIRHARPAQTKDRNRHEIAPLEFVDSDVRTRSGAQDVMDFDRIGNDGGYVQAQDAVAKNERGLR